MCELFILGNVIDVINDKKKKSVTIILEDNINNITSMADFLKHMNEFCPAFYEVVTKNNS